ncbi:hypothetical protein PHAVU_003G010000, partial [Phaseolus vulgaris]
APKTDKPVFVSGLSLHYNTCTPFTSVRTKTMCEFQAQTLFHSLPLSLFLSQTTNGSFKLST